MYARLARTNFRIQERMLGRSTFAILNELEKSQHWSRKQIQQLQLQRLQSIVSSAYENTVFWRSVMDKSGFCPQDIRTLADLKNFPLLQKETVRAEREDMVVRKGRRIAVVRTSGSTNEALQFYTNSEREAGINAARIRGHQWIGVNKGDREMYFWGSPIELSKQDRVKRFRDYLINDGLTNGFALKEEFVADYFQYWKRWRPKCIFGYPNTLTLMALMAQTQKIQLSTLRGRGLQSICTTSEMLTEPDRQFISEAFGVPVFDSYGLREAGLVGHECSHFTMHTMDEQLILETIDPHTLESTEGEGELVVTNVFSHIMPMIRYRTGDIVTLSSEPCDCGLNLNSVTISGGRVADFVITADGTWIPGYAFIYICRSVPGIVKFQVQQECLGEMKVLLVTDGNFPKDGIDVVTQNFHDRLRSEDRVNVVQVDDIQPAPSGKYRPVVSKVAQEQLQSSGHDSTYRLAEAMGKQSQV